MNMPLDVFLESATDEQRVCFKNLMIQLNDSEILQNEIKGIYSAMEFGVYWFSDGSRTLCENEDDALIISLKPRMRLEDVKKDIKKYLKQTVGLGMRDLAIVQNNYKHYVGESLPD